MVKSTYLYYIWALGAEIAEGIAKLNFHRLLIEQPESSYDHVLIENLVFL